MKHPIKTASPTLRHLFEIIERQGFSVLGYAELRDMHPSQVSAYRAGSREPRIMTVEEWPLP